MRITHLVEVTADVVAVLAVRVLARFAVEVSRAGIAKSSTELVSRPQLIIPLGGHHGRGRSRQTYRCTFGRVVVGRVVRHAEVELGTQVLIAQRESDRGGVGE